MNVLIYNRHSIRCLKLEHFTQSVSLFSLFLRLKEADILTKKKKIRLKQLADQQVAWKPPGRIEQTKKKPALFSCDSESWPASDRPWLVFEKVCRSANSQWPLNCSRWTVMTSCLLTQFGLFYPSFLPFCVCASVRNTHTCHLMTPSDHETPAALSVWGFFCFKRSALHTSSLMFKRKVTPCKAAQTFQRLDSPGWWWWPSRLLSPSAHCFQAQQWSHIKLVPLNTVDNKQKQRKWSIRRGLITAMSVGVFLWKRQPTEQHCQCCCGKSKDIKSRSNLLFQLYFAAWKQGRAASSYRPCLGAGSSLLFRPTSTECHFSRGPRRHMHTKQTHARMHEWVVTSWKQV